MPRVCSPLVLLSSILSPHAPAQEAAVRESVQVFRTYPFGDPDPVARMGNIYPYFRFQGYSNHARRPSVEDRHAGEPVHPRARRAGDRGKVLGAYEKSTGRAFIYYNRVMKFREIAMRGPWTSGGIEFNFGDIGHAPTTSNPVDYPTRKNPDGSVSCIVGALDLPSRTEWRVEIRLPGDRAMFRDPFVLVQSHGSVHVALPLDERRGGRGFHTAGPLSGEKLHRTRGRTVGMAGRPTGTGPLVLPEQRLRVVQVIPCPRHLHGFLRRAVGGFRRDPLVAVYRQAREETLDLGTVTTGRDLEGPSGRPRPTPSTWSSSPDSTSTRR